MHACARLSKRRTAVLLLHERMRAGGAVLPRSAQPGRLCAADMSATADDADTGPTHLLLHERRRAGDAVPLLDAQDGAPGHGKSCQVLQKLMQGPLTCCCMSAGVQVTPCRCWTRRTERQGTANHAKYCRS